MTRLRILLADDHEVVRRGIRSLLAARPEWEVCAEVCDGVQAVQRTIELQPDVLIIDISMPHLNGLQATCQILRRLPNQRVLVLTMYDSERILHDALQVGARGVVLKSDASLGLVRALEALEQNKTFFTPELTHSASRELLTQRELEVTRLVAEGKTSKAVGTTLKISTKTVETHRSDIMRKLSIHSVSELVLYAARNNIIRVGPELVMTRGPFCQPISQDPLFRFVSKNDREPRVTTVV
jgi:DNA-binding NarL/FixJ family response regulator